METKRSVSDWKQTLTPALGSKVSEFKMMGYSQATIDDIWDCLVKRVWKGNPEKRIHEAVQDIFHLGSSIYMSYLTMNAFQDDNDLMASIAAVTGEEQDG
ncbi:hypothetical protein DX933_12070 [Ornithinibacillus gellani]|uniref:post-transcriptional regulator n=1 Tax=Ornithinibacillus gellani TaxID=2293253 RepID=UPI000F48BD77|nr:post-transcriptional regulator [Ornithinibacillus gellani]TQS74664.1 hypothetical protein DX933_12070 [Ornithinibacillus gellani]